MRIETHAVRGVDASAISGLLHGLQNSPPDFLAVYASAACDLDHLCAEAQAAKPRAFNGATSCLGVMHNAGFVGTTGDGAGYFAIWDADGAYGSSGHAFEGDPGRAVTAALDKAMQRAGRAGETPTLVWVASTPGHEEEMIRSIVDVLGPEVPILGGSAADNTVAGEWCVFGQDGSFAQGVGVTVMYPSVEVATSFQCGYVPTGASARATHAEGRRLYTLDDAPADRVYARHTGLDLPETQDGAPVSILSQTSFNPMGRELTHIAQIPFHIMVHPAMRHADGSLSFFSYIETGTELHFMQGSPDSLTQRAGRVATQARSKLEANSLAGALVVYCAGCMLSVQDRMEEVAAGLDAALDGKPFLGLFTFGEQGVAHAEQNCHGNLMISCVTFSH